MDTHHVYQRQRVLSNTEEVLDPISPHVIERHSYVKGHDCQLLAIGIEQTELATVVVLYKVSQACRQLCQLAACRLVALHRIKCQQLDDILCLKRTCSLPYRKDLLL